MNLIKWANGCETGRLVSGYSKYSIKVNSQLSLVDFVALTLPPCPTHTAPLQVHALRWSQVLFLSQPKSQPEHFPQPTLQAQRWGAKAGGDLDSRISWLSSGPVETSYSNAFPGKKDVGFLFQGEKCLYSSPDVGNSKSWFLTVTHYGWINNTPLWRPLILYFAFAYTNIFQSCI